MTTKTPIPTESLFGLEYWPALPAFLISTADGSGTPHVAPYSLVYFPSYTNVAEAGDTPKVIAFLIGHYERFADIRKSRTYQNIVATGEFVVNLPAAPIVDQFNATVFPAPDKFKAAGLTAEPSSHVKAPSVAECRVNYECTLLRIEDNRWLGELIFGRVVAVRADQALQQLTAKERMEALAPIYHYAYDHYNGTYYSLGAKLIEEIDDPNPPR